MTYSILLCDDEPHILRAAEFKFKRSGFDVRCANNGEEALSLIQQRQPDIVVTDCQMPRMGGLELAKRLHDDAATADLPIIMLTAKGFELSAEELRTQFGIAQLLAKPFSPRELVACVEQVLEKTGRWHTSAV
jgi:DNA-binding response OmpR family regulator